MKETGLMFKAPLVRAILAGQKTQTRRVAKLPHMNPLGKWEPTTVGGPGGGRTREGKEVPLQAAIGHTRTGDVICAPIQVGDRIYVRETFVQGYKADPSTGLLLQWDEDGNDVPMTTWYRATDSEIGWQDDDGWETNPPWRPSIHMPKDLARIWLEVTGVRVERLHAITEADARAEGIAYDPGEGGVFHVPGLAGCSSESAIRSFQALWESTGARWDDNPWVWVIDFKIVSTLADRNESALP